MKITLHEYYRILFFNNTSSRSRPSLTFHATLGPGLDLVSATKNSCTVIYNN